MKTMTRLSATKDAQVRASRFASGAGLYDGVLLDTDDPAKLIPFVDQLLFTLRLLRFETRPITIRESKGVMEIKWSSRRPKAFGDRLVLCVSEGQHVDCF